MKHSFDEIFKAFEFVSLAPVDDNQAILNIATGEIVQKTGMLDEEEFPEEVETSDNYIWIPHKDDLDLGKGLIFDFVDLYMPEEKKAAKRLFRFGRAGAVSGFVKLLESLGKIGQWREFEKEETRNALLDWCDENEIEIDVD
jgi:hypothetical protein